ARRPSRAAAPSRPRARGPPVVPEGARAGALGLRAAVPGATAGRGRSCQRRRRAGPWGLTPHRLTATGGATRAVGRAAWRRGVESSPTSFVSGRCRDPHTAATARTTRCSRPECLELALDECLVALDHLQL